MVQKKDKSTPFKKQTTKKSSPFATPATKLSDTQSMSFKVSETPTAFLITIAGYNVGKMYKISNEKDFLIGRTGELDIMIDDETVSREHARISKDGEDILVIDTSTNGTYVNEEKINQYNLKDGDKIRIGETTILKFTFQDNLDRTYQEQLYEMSVKDALTGIYNKKYFDNAISSEFSYHRRHMLSLSLILFDIDNFKSINDTYGHLAGDFVIKEVARRISLRTRKENIFARYGGDEFIILSKNCNKKEAMLFSGRIQESIAEQEFIFNESKIKVTLSIGISTYFHDNFTTTDELFKESDRCLYLSKARGRNTISCGDDES